MNRDNGMGKQGAMPAAKHGAKRRTWIGVWFATWIGSLAFSLAPAAARGAEHPNIIFFLVDDLGWADLGCYGSEFYETPSINALCESGMKFTQAYAACPVCSPTRASILTGRHPVRVDITDWIPGRATPRNSKFLHVTDRDNLALREVTMAEVFKERGYQTFFAGKWHLGNKGHWPTDQGFDMNVGGNAKGSPPGGYYSPWKNPTLEASDDGEYVTERLTLESIKFMRARNKTKPFLLYLSYYNVHTPITPYKKRIDYFTKKRGETIEGETPVASERGGESRMRQDNADYASMVAAVDDSVGAILRTVKSLGLEEDTIICFFSDNGGLCTKPKAGPTSNLPLRAGKGWLYEGGIREPMIIRAPGVTKPGSECHQPVMSTDFFPTLLQLTSLPLAPELHADGVGLAPALRGEQVSARPLFWHYPHYHGSTWTPGAAVRDGDWKLIEFYETDEVELYNLKDDVGEKNNLVETHPDHVKRLRKMLRNWQTEMKAKMPQPRG